MSTSPTFTAGPPPSGSSGLRPLGVGEIIDVAIKLYRRNFGTLLRIVVVILLPFALLDFLVRLAALPSDTVVVNGHLASISGSVGGYNLAAAILSFLRAIIGLLVTGAVFRALSQAYLGRGEPDAGESLRFGLRRAVPLLWLTILTFLGLIIPFILLVIPGVFVLIRWTVAVPALMVEDKRGSQALGRSWGLVAGSWWRTFGALLLFYIVLFVVGLVLAAILGAVVHGTSSSTAIIFEGAVVTFLTTLIVTPLQAAVVSVLYFDLRVRKEGFDLQLLSDQLGLPGAGGAPVAPSAPAPAGPASTEGSTPPPSSTDRPDIGL